MQLLLKKKEYSSLQKQVMKLTNLVDFSGLQKNKDFLALASDKLWVDMTGEDLDSLLQQFETELTDEQLLLHV